LFFDARSRGGWWDVFQIRRDPGLVGPNEISLTEDGATCRLTDVNECGFAVVDLLRSAWVEARVGEHVCRIFPKAIATARPQKGAEDAKPGEECGGVALPTNLGFRNPGLSL
jgi:hypothetical protein